MVRRGCFICYDKREISEEDLNNNTTNNNREENDEEQKNIINNTNEENNKTKLEAGEEREKDIKAPNNNNINDLNNNQ